MSYHDLLSYKRYVLTHWTQWAADPCVDPASNDRFTLRQLHRDGMFQTERVDIAPHTRIVPHCHPHMDSVEYYVAGEGTLVIGGHTVQLGPHLLDLPPMKRCAPIAHDHIHSGVVGPHGVSFLSIQRWQGKPQSAVVDWDGVAPHAVVAA